MSLDPFIRFGGAYPLTVGVRSQRIACGAADKQIKLEDHEEA